MLSGQVGSAIAQLEYETTSNTLSAGLTYRASQRFELAIDGVWNDADAALEDFDFDVPADFLARNPNMSFDFSRTALNSDHDVSRLELGVHGRFEVKEPIGIVAGYRYLDFDDEAPYLYDTSGKVSFYSLGLAWTF